MSSVLTAAATIAAAVGAAAAYRYVSKRGKEFGKFVRERNAGEKPAKTIDCERDPETGIFRPKE